jgi:hypothetical protein
MLFLRDLQVKLLLGRLLQLEWSSLMWMVPSKVGYDGLIRNHLGGWIHRFSCYIGQASDLVA